MNEELKIYLWNEFKYNTLPNYAKNLKERGLIERGLAIAVTEENNPYK